MSNISSVYGWCVIEFDNPDADNLVTFKFKVSALRQGDWRNYLQGVESLYSAIDEVSEKWGEIVDERSDGNILHFTTNQIVESNWIQVIEYWQDFFKKFNLTVGPIIKVNSTTGWPQLTPSDQVRADQFEDFIDSLSLAA